MIAIVVLAIGFVALWRARHHAPRVRPRVVPLRAPAQASVLLLPTEGDDPGDSLRTIIGRDLEYGGWVRLVAPKASAVATAALRVTRTTKGVRIHVLNPRTDVEWWWDDFELPATSSAAWRDTLAAATLRWAIHGVADAVSEWVTGHRGIAQSRIAYVTKHELHVVDLDGAHDHIVDSTGIPMSPSWRHDGAAVVYSLLGDMGSQIVERDLQHQTRTVFPATQWGLNITPVYTPDDRAIVFARYDGTRTELAILHDPDTTTDAQPIHSDSVGDESSPSLSPDGSRVVFAAARDRTPQIYSTRLDGSDERLEIPVPNTGRSYRSSPDWSPDGRTIAFEQQNGDFQIWLLDCTNQSVRQLTHEGENEDPAWAPDGRHIAVSSTRNGAKDIWIIDVPTGAQRRLTTNGAARLAAWSPVVWQR